MFQINWDTPLDQNKTDACCTNSNKHRWKLKDIIEEIISRCRFLDPNFTGSSVRIHIILYHLEYLFPNHHANLSGMTRSQQTISREIHQLSTMWTKMWMISWNYTSESISRNIFHQSWCRMVRQVILGRRSSWPILCCSLVPSRLLHRNTWYLECLCTLQAFYENKNTVLRFVNRNNSGLFSSINLNRVQGSIKGVDFPPVALEAKAEQSVKIFFFLCCHSLLLHLTEDNSPSISSLCLSNPQWSHIYFWLLHKRCSHITGK